MGLAQERQAAEAALRSVLVLNKIVPKWAPAPMLAALALAVSPSAAQTPRDKEPSRPAATQAAQAPAVPLGPAASAYASGGATCTTARKRLWTEAGWIVRRVASCR
jgi:hypothetical protein